MFHRNLIFVVAAKDSKCSPHPHFTNLWVCTSWTPGGGSPERFVNQGLLISVAPLQHQGGGGTAFVEGGYCPAAPSDFILILAAVPILPAHSLKSAFLVTEQE